MRYNQFTYHKANPFYKQGFLPDRAWINRKPKQYPSEIPTGQDYFNYSGRRHYGNNFNHSEIQQTGVLKSPEKYPYQNRIALDKDYMRNLDTTDIQGAGSGTRVNEAIRYKLRAQQELARKHNQSLDMKQHKQHQYQQKRRQLALKNYQKIQQRKLKQQSESLQNIRVSQNPQKNKNDERRYEESAQKCLAESKNNQKYLKLLPKPYYSNLQSPAKQAQYIHKYIEPKQNSIQSQQQSPQKMQYQSQLSDTSRRQQQSNRVLKANDRYQNNPQNNPAYLNSYETQLERRRQENKRTIQIDKFTRQKLQDKREFRKNNPTNLSFNLAGQSIVSGMH